MFFKLTHRRCSSLPPRISCAHVKYENIKANLILLKVLQKQLDLELELYGDVKEKTSVNAIGKIYVVSLSSQPVDHEESTDGRQKVRSISVL